jgi:predicted MFS family arabinose efflux permease
MRSVIADLFPGNEYYKMMNYMAITWSIGPIIAPAIGGYLQYYLGWQASFYFLASYCVVAFVLIAIYMPETSLYKHPFRIKSILSRYTSILINKNYLSRMMINSTIYSLVVIFAVVGTFLQQSRLHYSVIDVGHLYLLTGLMWFLGTLTNRFFIHIPIEKKSMISLCCMFIIAVISLLLDTLIPINIYLIIIPVCLILWLGGIVYPNYFSRSIALFPTMTGSANALFSGFVYLISGVSSGFATYLKSSSQIPLALAYLVLTGCCLLLFFYNKNMSSN